MKKFLLVLSFIFLFASVGTAQTGKKTSLIIKNCEETETVCSTQHLFRYDFVNGEFVGKEKIFTTKTENVRFDLGRNRIYRNRFLITNWGDVIDLTTQNVVFKSRGELVEIDGDNVVIKVNRIDEKGIFVYNLQTGQNSRLKSPNIYELEGVLSPDKKFVAFKDNTKGFIFKEVQTGKEKIVKSLFGVGLSTQASEFGKLPILWLDGSRVLTQNSNGDLRIVHTSGKIERIVEIKLTTLPYRSPELYRNANGEIIYSCYDSFVIDVEKRKYRKYDHYPIGEGFSLRDDESVKSNWGTGSIYYFNDAEIGKNWSQSPVASNGFLAVVYGKEGTNLGYPDGIKVWNNIKRDWTTFEIKWSPEIIGWLQD